MRLHSVQFVLAVQAACAGNPKTIRQSHERQETTTVKAGLIDHCRTVDDRDALVEILLDPNIAVESRTVSDDGRTVETTRTVYRARVCGDVVELKCQNGSAFFLSPRMVNELLDRAVSKEVSAAAAKAEELRLGFKVQVPAQAVGLGGDAKLRRDQLTYSQAATRYQEMTRRATGVYGLVKVLITKNYVDWLRDPCNPTYADRLVKADREINDLLKKVTYFLAVAKQADIELRSVDPSDQEKPAQSYLFQRAFIDWLEKTLAVPVE